MGSRMDSGVDSRMDTGVDSEETLQRLRDALGSTLKWTRAAYYSENATFLNKSTVALKNIFIFSANSLGIDKGVKRCTFPLLPWGRL